MCVNANETDWNETFSQETCSFRLAYLESCFYFFRCIFSKHRERYKQVNCILKTWAILDIVLKKWPFREGILVASRANS